MNNSNSRIEIKESLSNSLTIIGGLFVLIGYLWANKDKHIGYIGEPLFISIVILILCYLLFNLYDLIKGKTVMAIDKQGVYHKKYGQMNWDDILSIKKTRKQSGDSEVVFLLFQTKRSSAPYKISISNMNISEHELVKIIGRHNDYNIYEVPYNEW
jgi:hypothetical protein